MTTDAPNTSARIVPAWPCCEHDADSATDSIGCRGRQVEPYAVCLAHLTEADRSAYLASLEPGADLDHRGTPFSEELLHELLTSVTDPNTNCPHIGNAWFYGVTISGTADFSKAQIGGDASFNEATISGTARFNGATIGGSSWFSGATIGGACFHEVKIGGDAWFNWVEISGTADFYKVQIDGAAYFHNVQIGDGAGFGEAAIGRGASFNGATIGGIAVFQGATIGHGASFNEATISGGVAFDQATIDGDAGFDGATIDGDAAFDEATISGDVKFYGVAISGDASFDKVKIGGDAWFDWATISNDAGFDEATISGTVGFDEATIGGTSRFGGATIDGDASFQEVTFKKTPFLGPLVCRGTLNLSGAVFGAAVTIEAATMSLNCRRTHWTSAAALRLRYAAVDFSDALMERPVTISSRPRPFTMRGQEMSEHGLTGTRVQATSIRGVDAAHLVLTDLDLTNCLFAGTIHLDQLRLEGRCELAITPYGVRRLGWWPMRWTPRRTLAEEQHWRAARSTTADGWMPAPEGVEVLEPSALAPVYRQLRKAFEDGKNEPGAADFYYGEMEMRRHAPETPRSEQWLLRLYWAMSGYGLRASRSLGWLLLTMSATVLVMMLWGLPKDDPQPKSIGTLGGQHTTMTTDTRDPVNPDGPYRERLSADRFEKSLRVVINSVAFRPSGQNLTVTGTYAEMASRLGEPVLLGLAALAVRGRVKR